MSEPAGYQSKKKPDAPEPARLAHLRQVAREMRDELAECLAEGQHPKVEAVHHLRTGTRRVEATLETLAREAGVRGLRQSIEEPRQRWLKQLKKVRRAAGHVRDLDVHREYLREQYLGQNDDSSAAVAATTATDAARTPWYEQAHLLDRGLHTRRNEAAEELVSTLEDHGRRLQEVEERFVAAFASAPGVSRRKPRPASQLALEDYLRLMDQMPHLDAANLHDFRKGAKKARYVAESDAADTAAIALAKAMKRVQDAIGDWHDLEVLAAEAAEALGSDGAALHDDLTIRMQKAFQRALRLTATAGRRFVGEWQAQRSRKPARRAAAVPARPRQSRSRA